MESHKIVTTSIERLVMHFYDTQLIKITLHVLLSSLQVVPPYTELFTQPCISISYLPSFSDM